MDRGTTSTDTLSDVKAPDATKASSVRRVPVTPIVLPAAFLDGMLDWATEDETRFHICGLYFHGLNVVATDGHKLARAAVLPEAGRNIRNFIMPRAALQTAIRAAGKRGTIEIACSHEEGGVVHGEMYATPVKGSPVRVAWKSVDAKYAAYDQVIPAFDANPDTEGESVEPAATRCAGVGLNPRYLAAMVPVVDGMARFESKSENSVPVVLRSAARPLDPVVFTAHVKIEEGAPVKAGKRKPGKEGREHDPSRRMITFVIMPCRT